MTNEETREQRMENIRAAAKDARKREAGSPAANDRAPTDYRDAALWALEQRAEVISSEAGDSLTSLIERDHSGIDSRYIHAVASPAYERAFARMLLPGGPDTAIDADELTALRQAGQIMHQRAMSVGTGSSGGFAVPFALDPTIMLTNNGTINPIRELATVTTITTNEWRGISSEGVQATFAPELTEVGDGSPVLEQPTIPTEKAQAWVPYSIEVGQDWTTLTQELTKVFSDARANLEASVFIGGTASPQPVGLVTGGTATVNTAGTATLAYGDIYTLQEALPPRYQPKARFLASNTTTNRIHQFVAKGDETNAALMTDDRSSILGKPLVEVSTLSSGVSTGDKPLVYGDIAAGYRIVDRIGMTVEPVRHVLGENLRPIGARGLYAYWRTGAKVQAPNAVRVLEVT